MKKRAVHLSLAVACLFMAWVNIVRAANGTAPPREVQNGAANENRTPAVVPVHGTLDSELIRHGGDTPNSTTSTTFRPVGMELPRVAGALAIVLGLIVALRYAAKKLFVSPSAKASTRAVQVLSRSAIAPRQHILLLRVGRRVIVVGDSGAKMNPLSEITDADEVAALLGQLQDEKTPLPSRAFSAFFNRARGEAEDEDSAIEQADGARMPADSDETEQEDEIDEAAVSERREELTGLMDKIRVLSKHFRTET